MEVALTAQEFYDKNDKDVRRILSYVANRADTDLIDELTQDFYLGLLHNKVLSRFNPGVENCLEQFKAYIYKCCENTVFSYAKDKRRSGNPNWISSINARPGYHAEIDVLSCMSLLADQNDVVTIHKNFIPSMHDSLFNEERFYELLKDFEGEIDRIPGASDNVKDRYKRYLTAAKSGSTAVAFAKRDGVSVTYISRVRATLSKRFRAYAEQQDGGLGYAFKL